MTSFGCNNYVLILPLCRQIEIDSEFLRTNGIMDYSLLLGFHYRARRNLQSGSSYPERILPDKLTVLSEAGKHAILYISLYL